MKHPRCGYLRMLVLLRRDEEKWNRKRFYRRWRKMKLQVLKKYRLECAGGDRKQAEILQGKGCRLQN
ncbi:MAG: hypothetical protein ACK5NT_13110 [Pyrinomonadaceae bacterium]